MKREEALKLSEDALERLTRDLEAGESDSLLEYLETMSRFHDYSFRNVMMILSQCPHATRVAGFRSWQQMGRWVKKGEHGIAILAPLVYKRKDEETSAEENQSGKVLMGFRVVYVFDLSQTDGKPLPDIDLSVTGEPGEALSQLKALAASEEISVSYEELPEGTYGVSRGGSVAIQPGLPAADEFSVLVHELAHELLHRGERRHKTTHTIRETEAEAVAFVVSTSLGLCYQQKAADYIQLHGGDKDALTESLDHIQRAATRILSAIEAKAEPSKLAATA